MKAGVFGGAVRRFTQAGFTLFFLLMPALDILRYDAAERKLFIFRRVWSLGLREGFYLDGSGAYVAWHIFTNAILPWLVVLAVFPLLGALLGRFFCGWLCPEGLIFEVADYFTRNITGGRRLFDRGPRARVRPVRRAVHSLGAAALLLTVPPAVGACLTGFFIDPARIWREAVTLSPSFGLKAGIVGVWTYMIVTSVFLRHSFCKYVCSAGLMQMLLGWVSPVSLRVRFDRAHFSRCTDCRRCERVCFMDVKPRLPRRDINCVNCGLCIAACEEELGEGFGLFGLGFGDAPDGRQQDTGGEAPGPCDRALHSP